MKNSFAKPVCFSKLLYFIVIIFISGQVFNGLLFFQNKKIQQKKNWKKNHRKLKEKTYYLWYKHTQFVEKVDREMTQSFDGGKVVEGGLIAQWAQYFFFYQKKNPQKLGC